MPGFDFARQLARNFGRADYFNMLRSMSSTELDHWYKDFSERPMYQETMRWQLAQIAAGIYRRDPSDFIPQYQKPRTEREQIAIWQSLS